MDLLREVMAVLDEETGRRETMTVSTWECGVDDVCICVIVCICMIM